MAEFPSVTVDLSEQLEFPGDSYPLTGKVDVATYTVGEKEYQLHMVCLCLSYRIF